VPPYLDDFMATKQGLWACVRLARRLENNFVRAGLRINVPKCHIIPSQQRRQIGFDVEALRVSVDAILTYIDVTPSCRHGGSSPVPQDH
jgi:hypothetical protein